MSLESKTPTAAAVETNVESKPPTSAVETNVESKPPTSAVETNVESKPPTSAVETNVESKPPTSVVETNVESKNTVQEHSQIHTEDQNKAADSTAHIDKYTALAQLWFDEYKIQDFINPRFIELWHIKKIDNIAANAYICVTNSYMQLVVESHNVKWALRQGDEMWRYYKSQKMYYSTVEDCAFIIKEFGTIIETIRYNKLNSLLQFPSKIAEVESIVSIFGGETSNIESNCGMCAICHEDTYVTTDCDHHVCVPCADQCIEISGSECCPICRDYTGLARALSARDSMQSYTITQTNQETW
jgi:hypothetical protein